MNTKNNKRKRQSQESIEKAFLNMLLEKELTQISVTDICKETGLNRSTFYANYIDILSFDFPVCSRCIPYCH